MSIWYFRFWCLQHIFSFPSNICTESHVISIALHNLLTDKTNRMGDRYYSSSARSTKHDGGLMGPVFHLGHIRPVYVPLEQTFKVIFSCATGGQSEEVWVKSQTLHRVVSAQMTHLLSQQQPADEERRRDVGCLYVGAEREGAVVSAHRSLDRSTERPKSFANSSAVSEPLSDTCTGTTKVDTQKCHSFVGLVTHTGFR